ncbi:MAG: hypothetical protein ACXVLX_05835 [Ilumatobacteraceae bacterium]
MIDLSAVVTPAVVAGAVTSLFTLDVVTGTVDVTVVPDGAVSGWLTPLNWSPDARVPQEASNANIATTATRSRLMTTLTLAPLTQFPLRGHLGAQAPTQRAAAVHRPHPDLRTRFVRVSGE